MEPTEEKEVDGEVVDDDEVVETSLRDDLEAAIVEEESDESTEETIQDETTDAPQKDDEKIGGAKGKDESVGGGEGKGGKGINAPIGFSPESREQWGKVPDVVKAQVHKREQDIAAAMANTAEARRSHAEITKLADNYAPVLAAEGASTPMQAISTLFKTVAELRMGTPAQSAQRMAGLIKHYNINIKMLDEVLSGEISDDTRQGSEFERILDDRLAPVQDLLRSNAAREKASATASQDAVNQELQTFAETAEFLGDVRNDMADLIDLASKRGRKMSFEEAYKKACAMSPEISKVIDERAAAEKLKNNGQRLRNKRNVASSIPQHSASGSSSKGTESLRDTLSAAWDAETE